MSAVPSTVLVDPLFRFLLLTFTAAVDHRQRAVIAYLRAENRVLREQLGNKRLVFTDAQRIRLGTRAQAVGREALAKLDTIVVPETLFRWYRQLVAKKYTAKTRGRGRPRTAEAIEKLVLEMALDNPSWGYSRIRGALLQLGHVVGRTTIANILARNGIDPVPHRGMAWADFLRAHFGHIFAADFFTVEVLTVFGLVRYHVLFFIDIETRRVHIGGIVHNPGALWVKQRVLEVLDPVDGFMRDATHFIVDRDPTFSADVKALLRDSGVEVCTLPARSPNLNAHAERFVGSVRRECLSKIIPIGERHLRHVLGEYMVHYHEERPHQGLGNRLIEPIAAANGCGPVRCRERLGGLLRFYHRNAA